MRPVLRTALLLLSAAAYVVASEVTFVGAWKFNPHKSHFSHGELPQSLVITVRAWGAGGIRYQSKNLVGEKTGGITFTAKLDGTRAPVAGTSAYDTVSVKQIDPHTLHVQMKKSGALVVDITYRLAPDGRSLSREGNAWKTPGHPNHFREWFDRQ